MRPIVQNLEAGVAGGRLLDLPPISRNRARSTDRQAAASGGSGPDDASAAAAGLLVHFIVPLLQMYFPPSPPPKSDHRPSHHFIANESFLDHRADNVKNLCIIGNTKLSFVMCYCYIPGFRVK